MRRLITLLLIIPALAVGQSRFGHGGSGGVSVSSLLPIIADSTLWHLQGTDTLVTDGALPVKVSGLRVSGTTRLDGTLTLITTAAESLLIAAGGIRNEGGLLQKGAATFGATGTTATIGTDGAIAGQSVTATETLGAELITGATAMSTWTPAANWTYSTSWAHATGVATALITNWAPTAAAKYKLTFTLTTTTDGTGLYASCGSHSTPIVSASGTYTYYFTAINTTALAFTPYTGGTWVGTLSNVSIKVVSGGAGTFNSLTLTSQIMLQNGNYDAPSIAFSAFPKHGYYIDNTGSMWTTINGSRNTFQGGGAFGLYSASGYFAIGESGWYLGRDAGVANTTRFGLNGASPAAQLVKAPDNTGTNGMGAKLSLASGRGTGTGYGQLSLQVSPTGAAGTSANALVDRVLVDGDTCATVKHIGLYGSTSEKLIVITKTGFTGATMTLTNAIPAGCIVQGVTTRVTTLITGGAGFTGFSVGDGSDVDRWGANLNPAANETSDLTDCTITSMPIYAAATSIVVTAVGNDFTAGALRVVVHVKMISAPDS